MSWMQDVGLTWHQIALGVGLIFILGTLTTISNQLAEISRQVRNLSDDLKLEMTNLGDKIEDVGTRLGMDIRDLDPRRERDRDPPR